MLSLLKNLKKKEWIAIVISTAFIVLQVWLDLKLPDYMAEITRILGNPNGELADIWLQGGYMMLCALGSALASVAVGYLVSRVAARFSARIREMLFSKVLNFSASEINKFSTPSLITRTTNDVTQVQGFIAMGLQVIIKAPILATWAVLKILDKSLEWSLVTAVAVGILLVMVLIITLLALPKFKKIQTLTDNLNLVTRENLTGIRVVRAFNAEEFQQQKFEKANDDLTKTHLFTSKIMALMFPVMSFVMMSLSLSIYWVGAYLINNAQLMDKMIVFSDMMVFTSYAMQVIMAFMMLTMIFIFLPRTTVSSRRINEVLKTQNSIIDGTLTKTEKSGATIEFKNVGFKYPDAEEYVLKNINLKINTGERVAFIGSTGSGKSTLINLVPRFYDATEGEILINGTNVKDLTKESLNNMLGYISQKAVLFSGTVESNIMFGDSGKEITEKQVKKALKIAQANFVDKMTDGVKSSISQGGTNVSGGQKQRLSIARAVAKNPAIYIFDDTFSALDYKTDQKLRRALKEYTKNATTLIVAQRIGTIKDCDKIVVLENGEVVGIGTHEKLLKSNKVYREIALSQLSKEEL